MATAYPIAPGVSFKFIEGDEGYCVGDDGSVWSRVVYRRGDDVRLGEWRRLKATPQYRGHQAIWLGRGRQRFVHRLVLEAFVGPCPDGMECRHLDDDPGNNRLGNLCWGTPAENTDDRFRNGRVKTKLSDDQVRFIRSYVDLSRRDGMSVALANMWGVTPALIYQIASGKMRRSVV